MNSWNKKNYVIPSEYNERGNPQNQNFLTDAHVSPFGFISMTQNFWTVFVLKHMKILLLSLLFIQPLYAEYITNDIISGCDGDSFYVAHFAAKQISCSSGYYLPANALSCESCPSGYICNGGTYAYNPNIFQGAEYTTLITNNMNNVCAGNAPIFLRAVFQPHTITINWDDGTNIIQNTCLYGELIKLPPTPVRPGYVFSGWRLKQQN